MGTGQRGMAHLAEALSAERHHQLPHGLLLYGQRRLRGSPEVHDDVARAGSRLHVAVCRHGECPNGDARLPGCHQGGRGLPAETPGLAHRAVHHRAVHIPPPPVQGEFRAGGCQRAGREGQICPRLGAAPCARAVEPGRSEDAGLLLGGRPQEPRSPTGTRQRGALLESLRLAPMSLPRQAAGESLRHASCLHRVCRLSPDRLVLDLDPRSSP
mmetsp:Transcript_3183/g.8312  ORF Transcript_3183/g.8312 Transcript_3183/m.8312 type:complete len:213 (+) Transcript_3183:1454-2092(+)